MKVLITFIFILFCYYNNSFGQNDTMAPMGMNEIDINPASILYGHPNKKGMWMFSYNYANAWKQNNFSGTNKINDGLIFEKYIMAPVNMQSDMHMLMGMYGVSNKLSLMVMFNYAYMTMDMKMLTNQSNLNYMMGMGSSIMNITSISQGFADTRISGLYNLLADDTKILIADIGVSVPTGSINKTEKDNLSRYGKKQVYSMQTGSGTFDFMPGLIYLYRQKTYLFGTQATSVIHPYYNTQGYKLGNEFALNAWAAYQWWQKVSVSVRLNYSLSGQIQGSASDIPAPLEPDADPKNYGGSFVKGFIGLAYFFYDDFLKNDKVSAEFGIPVYQNYNGIQTAINYNLIISWGLNF